MHLSSCEKNGCSANFAKESNVVNIEKNILAKGMSRTLLEDKVNITF